MKQIAFIIVLVGFASRAFAQAFIALDNIANTSTNIAATANGLFWLATGGTPALIHQDFNAAFYGGTDSASLALVRSFTGAAILGDNAYGPGTFADLTGSEYAVPGTTTASASAFFRIEAWTGNFNSYAAALSGGAPTAQSPVFINPVGVPPSNTPDFVNMPAMVLDVPEPSTFALLGLGALWLVIRRCRLRKP